MFQLIYVCRVTDITGCQPTIRVQRIWTEGSVAVSHLRSAVDTSRKAKAKKTLNMVIRTTVLLFAL